MGNRLQKEVFERSRGESSELVFEKVKIGSVPPLVLAACKITVNGCNITELPEFGFEDVASTLISLHAERNKLRVLPPAMGALTALVSLNLFRNKITSLPDELFNCVSLRKLILHKNALTEIPPGIGRLSKLKFIFIGGNKIRELPTELFAIPSLIEVHAQENALTELPEGIGSASHLRILNVRNNKITSLPNSIGSLIALQQLSVWGNKLAAIPDSIEGCMALTSLVAHRNVLTDLPYGLIFCTFLDEVSISSNAFSGERKVWPKLSVAELKAAIAGPCWEDAVAARTASMQPAAMEASPAIVAGAPSSPSSSSSSSSSPPASPSATTAPTEAYPEPAALKFDLADHESNPSIPPPVVVMSAPSSDDDNETTTKPAKTKSRGPPRPKSWASPGGGDLTSEAKMQLAERLLSMAPDDGLFTMTRNKLNAIQHLRKTVEVHHWLVAMLGVPLSSDDLWIELRDGIKLCQIGNKLLPGACRVLDDSHPFHQRDNTASFLRFARAFGMDPMRLFEVNDLYQRRNVVAVVDVLHELAQKAHEKGDGPVVEQTIPLSAYTPAQIALAVAQLSSREDQAVRKATLRMSSGKKAKKKAKAKAEAEPEAKAEAALPEGLVAPDELEFAQSLDAAMLNLLEEHTHTKLDELVETALAPPPETPPPELADAESNEADTSDVAATAAKPKSRSEVLVETHTCELETLLADVDNLLAGL
ncbi:uncharacterized protein AMSG_05020 [Thecamonas trahens ATCC 50062]|uniref:Calponin-homology (CH) domain-containing protein n=1 Tax=Thecamonas trahens ATCC 50062 TaxID=461836 RepID=A0A0L0DAH0_THETB|nr:hypothetical protein AMSG_05020 [Thecamonas trahens ATCC 50062]KNC49061.1 hypothetical protein AMSG_05020 [Thecamonas trahens ATCC 50062]|eukprot:XP_013758094.1 hypothetical protein AMSG_05020 [Thecamonas trahens ATCC 50062]